MKTDWVAEIFRAMRDCGEDISIIYGRCVSSGENSNVDWYELPHDEYDGMSGLASLMRKAGYTVSELPQWQGDDKYSFRNAVKGLKVFLPTTGIREQQWIKYDRSLPILNRSTERIAWTVFSKQQTSAIKDHAKTLGVTVNSYLLSHLDRLIAENLVPNDAERRWMIPVNLRGAVSRASEQAPQMAFIALDFSQIPLPIDVQEQVNARKRQGYQWGAWAAFVGSFLLGKKGIRSDMQKRESKNHGWTGMFSNLGKWDIKTDDNWLFCPAVSRVYPVGAGCVTVNGQLTLSMQFHEALQHDLASTQALLNHWAELCVNAIPQEINISKELAFG